MTNVFGSKVDLTGPCWLWLGGLTNAGYGRFYLGARRVIAHRYAWESTGNTPCQVLHHICHNKLCVRPDHLAPTTFARHRREHMLAYCKRGHALTPDNLYVSKGTRWCRQCGNLRNRQWRKRNK